MSFKWAAGLIDAEGSFCLYYSKRGARNVMFSISMTDPEPIEIMSKLFGHKIIQQNPTGRAKQHAYRIKVGTARNVADIINKVLPHLVLKRQPADILLAMTNIIQKHTNNHGYKYSTEEHLELFDLESALHVANTTCPSYIGNPDFSFEWLAGFTDGDGSIYAGSCGTKTNKSHRLVYKISVKSKETIDYINNHFKRTNLNNKYDDKRPNRNPLYTFRMVSGQAALFITQLLPHSTIKNEQILLGIELNQIRSSRQTAQQCGRINEIIDRLKTLNKNG